MKYILQLTKLEQQPATSMTYISNRLEKTGISLTRLHELTNGLTANQFKTKEREHTEIQSTSDYKTRITTSK